MTAGTFRYRDDRQRRLETEIQDGFRGQLDLLALGCGLHAAANTAARCGSDSRAFAASGDAADDRSDGRSGTNFSRGVFTTGAAFTAILIGLNGVRLSAHRNSIQLQNQFRLARKFACTLHVYNMALYVMPGGKHDVSFDRQGRVEGGFEALTSLCRF